MSVVDSGWREKEEEVTRPPQGGHGRWRLRRPGGHWTGCVGEKAKSPASLGGVDHCEFLLPLGDRIDGESLHRHRLRQLVFPLVRHLPRQESAEVRWSLAVIVHTGVEEGAEPKAETEAPQDNGLEDAKHHRSEVRTPDAA